MCEGNSPTEDKNNWLVLELGRLKILSRTLIIQWVYLI